MRRVAFLVGVMVAGVVVGQTVPATRGVGGKFTIGKETTVVEGPLMGDGTIDYVRVFNEEFGAGVVTRDNAAVLLYEACVWEGDGVDAATALEALGVAVPKKAVLPRLEEVAGEKGEEAVALLEKGTRERVWKSAEYPVVAAWLKASEKGLALVEEACERPRYFAPLYRPRDPQSFLGIPPLGRIRTVVNGLMSRAMLRAGEGDFDGALRDVQRLQKLARLMVQEPLAIHRLLGIAADTLALQACRQLLTQMDLTAEQLRRVHEMIGKAPRISEAQAGTARGERLVMLEVAMTFMRGDTAGVLRGYSGEFKSKAVVDPGDLAQVDWNVFLKTANQEMDELLARMKKPATTLQAQLAAAAERETAAVADGRPGYVLYATPSRPAGIKPVEAYLRMRAGEDRAGYSARVARFFAGSDPGYEVLYAKLRAGYDVRVDMTVMADGLAQYRAAHGTYPASLEAAGLVVADPFSGTGVHYVQEGKGYRAWSVGPDLKDDWGEEGVDFVVRAEK